MRSEKNTMKRGGGQLRGFTLVEMLLVVAVIGIFATIAFASYSGAQKATRDAKRQAALNEIAAVFEAYRSVVGNLPNCSGGLVIQNTGGSRDFVVGIHGSTACSDATAIRNFFDNNVTSDIVDPSGEDNVEFYFYYDSSHSCGDQPTQALLYTNMEVAENSNRDEVCTATGGTAPAYANNEGWYNYNNTVSRVTNMFVISLGAI